MFKHSQGILPIKERPILSSPSTLTVPLSAAPYRPPLHDLLGHNKVDRVIVLREILVGLAPVNSTVAVSATQVSNGISSRSCMISHVAENHSL